ncbi:MAG: Re/Si-specific NAD(P)(+) transhydrogenase subunit alpha [Candidatus Latescibacteria bacterium]|nr:Re/Si-specific NAD(P)(+) transhydrogenase subunit alpha [Candidatus Latescibacterota bacterium]
MHIVVPDEFNSGETRVPLIPEHAAKLVKAGLEVSVESGLGKKIEVTDDAYVSAGAKVFSDRNELFRKADIIVRLHKPSKEEINKLKEGCVYASLLDPFNEKELIETFMERGVSAISMEMIPRTTLAQKMDVLSSQASLAGYVAVILGAERLNKILPMMMTPAGTIKPAHVFIIGAGVAGLQAIATAKRMGARVSAFDTRPVVEEQVKSLGARFVKVDLGETGQTEGGYAKALTGEQLQKQREEMAKVCASADIVITTAQLFGRKAPVIITKEMVQGMQPGSVLIDLAVESGGNIEGSRIDKEVDVNGILIIGLTNLPGRVPVHASQMYSANMFYLIDQYWNAKEKSFNLDLEDEIIRGCLITHQKKICNEMILNFYNK